VKKIRAILVDDEESARDVLENLLKRFCPEVELLAKCNNVEQAVTTIRELQPDLVFLDIEMPNYAGYEIVKFFPEINFELIFVTAYDKYAIRAFEVSALDYLLKPIDIDRLKNAVNRVMKQREVEHQIQRIALLSETLESKQLKNLVVTDKGQQHIIVIDNIIAIEAQESYCIIHYSDKTLVASKNLKHFEIMLETAPAFFRVHKSWIIHKAFLKTYSKSELTIHLEKGIVAKLSKYKKAEFEAWL
jgi:two-component system, LytTR family, response regulator